MFQDFELELDELRAGDDNPQETFNDGGANDEEILAKLDQDPKKATVRRIQPKLDPERVCGPRGIESIPKLFEDFKIYGKNREVEPKIYFDNLNNMMNKLEHWAHRLFPKMPFDEVLGKLETLGSKRMIQNTLSRIRNGEAMDEANFVENPSETAEIFSENIETEETFSEKLQTEESFSENFLETANFIENPKNQYQNEPDDKFDEEIMNFVDIM